MLDFDTQREKMVDNQIRPSDVTNHDLLSAFLKVPREKFVPENLQEFAYIDEDLKLHGDRCLMEPASFAKLLQALRVSDQDVVLDVGCTSGYSSAVIAQLASFVVGLEEEEALATLAKEQLDEMDIANVSIFNGTLAEGYEKHAPYDVILIGGCVEEVPAAMFAQLKEGGRLACVLGAGNAAEAILFTKNDGLVTQRTLFNCAVKPLPGFSKPVEFAL